nr:DNA cytosine methyltransferase [Desulfobacula sp.]
MNLTFLDLFAGAGGLSEGFIGTGFEPVAHVESDQAACFTLRTRMAYHWLNTCGHVELYADYLKGCISRTKFYEQIPERVIGSVINAEIGALKILDIFRQVDSLLENRRLDLIVGGPPCQAYSIVGRSRDGNQMKGDKRNYLYLYYAEFLKRYQPLYFVFENVIGLLSAKDEDGRLYFNAMRDLFFECGYETEFMTLSAEDYGILQNRKRIILVGRRGKTTGFYPEPDKWNPKAMVKEAFCDLPEIGAGEGVPGPCHVRPYHGTWQIEARIRNEDLPVTWHQARPHTDQDLEIYRIAVDLWNRAKMRLDYNSLPEHLKTHRQRDSFLDRFKVVASDLPFSHTVVAHIAKDGHYYIHPDIDQNRSITPREAARLQTFPDDYYFESSNGIPSRTPTFRQIGNAVPVLLSRKIADKLKEVWL